MVGKLAGSANNSAGSKTTNQLCASIAVIDQKLFVHFNNVLDSNSLVVFDTDNLKYENTMDLRSCVNSHRQIVSESNIPTDIFNFNIVSIYYFNFIISCIN